MWQVGGIRVIGVGGGEVLCENCYCEYSGEPPDDSQFNSKKGVCSRCSAGAVVAVLSATVLPIDGTYEIKKIPIFWGEAETSKVSPSLLVGGESRVLDLTGIKHYIGHPSTALIVEGWGAIKAESNLFAGLDVGQYAFAVSIKQGLSTRKNAGKTYDQVVTEKDLIVRRIKRIA